MITITNSLQKTEQSIEDILTELAANTAEDRQNEKLAANIPSRSG
jgi:hypothetical protein